MNDYELKGYQVTDILLLQLVIAVMADITINQTKLTDKNEKTN